MVLEKVEKVNGAFHYVVKCGEQEYLIENDTRMSLEELKERLDEGKFEM